MALNRKLLQGMGLSEEQIDTIITEHTTVTTSLKDQIDTLKEEAKETAEKLTAADKVQKELDKLKADDWQGKYTKEHGDFEAYKQEVADKETSAKVKAAYRKLLTEAKVGDKQLDSIIGVTDFSGMKLKEDGSLDNADELKKAIETKWSGFITTTGKQPSGQPETPPESNGGRSLGRGSELAKQYYEGKYGKLKED